MKRRFPIHLLKTVALTGIVLLATGVLVLALSPKPLLVNRKSASQAVYSEGGDLLRLSLASDEKYRLWVPLQEISPRMRKAVLFYEDRHFYAHPGVNPFSLLRAFFHTYVTSDRRVGGSTISMQLARLRFAINSRSVLGKLEQIARALQLEWHYSKDEILEAYLNLAPYGGNIEGVAAASMIYFNTPASRLTAAQAFSLAVIPQNPTKRGLHRTGATDVASPRTRAVARLAEAWLDEHSDDIELKNSYKLPLSSLRRAQLPWKAPHFVENVLRASADEPEVVSTLSEPVQKLAEKQTSAFISRRRSEGIRNAAVIILDWQDMEVRALVGSADYYDKDIDGQVDGTRGRRSPGSTLKPFIYALAMQEGLIHPNSLLKDTPLRYAAYDPENFDRQFVGPISAQDALVRSRNVPAVFLANSLSGDGLYAFLRRAGIQEMESRDHYGLSIALGGVELTLQELTSLYAALANGGEQLPIRFTRSTKAGKKEAGLRLLSPEISYLTLDMLAHNPRPDEEMSFLNSKPHSVSWKTGTSFGFRDAWAIGVAGQYVVAVWVGNFDGRANPEFIGRGAAGHLFFDIVDAARAQGLLEDSMHPLRQMKGLTGVRKVELCSLSGALPGKHCPHRRLGFFVPGVSPIGRCEVHREVLIDVASGMRSCRNSAEKVRHEVYEFWPSDILRLYADAGLSRRVPPPFAPYCRDAQYAGRPPSIVSPQKGLTYHVRLSELKERQMEVMKPGDARFSSPQALAFQAVSDSDVTRLSWFVNERFVGTSDSGASFLWEPRPGKYVVRVVDERGGSDARDITVETLD